jgi:Raf kinase inhibitor-like YbhB/YbcL family protein
MKYRITIITGVLWLAASGLIAQPAPPAREERDRLSRNEGPPPEDRQGDSQPLTAEQKGRVKGILSKYSAASLTAKDAKAINEAFREAGLRNGPGLQEAIREAGFEPEKIGELDPPPDRPEGGRRSAGSRRDEAAPGGRPGGRGEGNRPPDRRRPEKGGGYSIEQAVSDRAQLTTIAFDGLAFLTGDMGCNTFLPPGKVADFCGFQYMRDVDTNELGHNTSFVPRAANPVLHILTDDQKAQLVALGKEQEKLLTEFAYKRFPLIKAFCRQLEGDIPAGSAGLNREAVMRYTADIFELDGRLSYRRAQVLGGIIRSLTAEQKQYLGRMKFNSSSTWPEMENQLDKNLSHTVHVAVMTYASEMFSWYAGNVEADVYFCPERHATYFGSFYMKDIPAMGNPNYSISTSLTGDSGEAFLAALTEPQRKLVTGLVDQQRGDLDEIVKTRRAIATELRRFMKLESIDKDKVTALSRRYGELDGEISYFYATAFAKVGQTLTPEQRKALLKLRNLDARYACKGAYLYSHPVGMPEIASTDFLFVPPAATRPTTVHDVARSSKATTTSLVLRSPEVADGGQLPKEYTGDGSGATLPLEWSGAPTGTRSLAVIMHHIDPEGIAKWYWVLYNISPDTRSLPKNVTGVGTLGNNSINGRVGYAPPHSKGPGAKTYIYTLYALSEPVKLDVEPSAVSRDVLLAAIKGHILASAQLEVVYSRSVNGDRAARPDDRPRSHQADAR